MPINPRRMEHFRFALDTAREKQLPRLASEAAARVEKTLNDIGRIGNVWAADVVKIERDEYLSLKAKQERIADVRTRVEKERGELRQEIADRARRAQQLKSAALDGRLVRQENGFFRIDERPARSAAEAVDIWETRRLLEAAEKGKRLELYQAAVEKGNAVVMAAVEEHPLGPMVDERWIERARVQRFERSPFAAEIQLLEEEARILSRVMEKLDETLTAAYTPEHPSEEFAQRPAEPGRSPSLPSLEERVRGTTRDGVPIPPEQRPVRGE